MNVQTLPNLIKISSHQRLSFLSLFQLEVKYIYRLWTIDDGLWAINN